MDSITVVIARKAIFLQCRYITYIIRCKKSALQQCWETGHNFPTARRKQTTRCSNQTEVSLVLSSCKRGKGDSELRTKGVRRKKKPYIVPLYTQSNYITIAS